MTEVERLTQVLIEQAEKRSPAERAERVERLRAFLEDFDRRHGND